MAWRRHAVLAWLMTGAIMIITAATALPANAALPANTISGIHLALPFNQGEKIANGTVVGESGVVDYVWGAVGNPGNIPGGSTWHESYIPWGRDPQVRPPSWFLANHPTWVMYTEDQHTPATLFGEPSPVLDMTNPEVQAWIENQADAALASGFQGISWDNGVVYNEGHAVGHYDANGQWIQQYSGAAFDPAYADAQTTAFAAVTNAIKSRHPNTSDTLNQPFSCDSTWSLPLASADMLLDEQGFTNYGEATNSYVTSAPSDGCSNNWLQRVQAYVRLQKELGKGLVLLNEEPYQVRSDITDTSPHARADLQWALANYLLVKYAHTYFWWGGIQQYGGPPLLQREYSAPIGSPIDDVHAADGVYVRNYTNGLAIVNPDPTQKITVHLPTGYHDLYGHAVTQLALPRHSGIVLLGPPQSGWAGFRPRAHARLARAQRLRVTRHRRHERRASRARHRHRQ